MNDDELRDLQERVSLIAEMAASPGWTMLVDRAHASIRVAQQRVLRGLLEHDEYLKQCANMEGMFFILDLPAKVQAELDQELGLRAELQEEEEELDDAA